VPNTRLAQLSPLNVRMDPKIVEDPAGQIRNKITADGVKVSFKQTGAGTEAPAIHIMAPDKAILDEILPFIDLFQTSGNVPYDCHFFYDFLHRNTLCAANQHRPHCIIDIEFSHKRQPGFIFIRTK